MYFSFHNGFLDRTDYFASTDCRRGLAWTVIADRAWHVFLPQNLTSCHVVQAEPEEDLEEPDGWSWCLDVDGVRFPLPTARMQGDRPSLPDRGGYLKRIAYLYTGLEDRAGRAAFAGVRNGASCKVCSLWLVNGMQVGYKPPAPRPR